MKIQLHNSSDSEAIIKEFPSSRSVMTIGRNEESDIVLSDRSVSRRHAEIFRCEDIYGVRDLGSSGGTWVEGKRISELCPLPERTSVQVGAFTLMLLPEERQVSVLAESAEEKEEKVEEHDAFDDLPSFDDFEDFRSLYSQESMKLIRRIHTYILEKLNLPENALKDFNTDEMREKLETCLDQTLRELRHELPGDVALPLLRQVLLDELVGYGPISPLLRASKISEVMVNGPDKIFIESSGRLFKTDIQFHNEAHLISILQRIVEPLGRHVDAASPMVDARLPDGSRVNAIIPPLAIHGSAITIRKFPEKKMTTDDLIRYGSLTQEMGLFLQEAVRSRQNILVSGGTGSGKTTLLNILSQFIPHNERVITVEDSAELKLSHDNIVSLEARPANIEGQGRITIRDLVINTLRMRPDRIIVGECRGAEALDMLQAMNTGHDGSLTTCHANNPRDALSRLENMVMMAGYELPSTAIREQIASAINLVVQQTRFPDGSRKVVKISEVTGREGSVILLQDIFTFEQEGFDASGKVQGYHTPTGNIPRFVEELRASGDLKLDMSVFVPRS